MAEPSNGHGVPAQGGGEPRPARIDREPGEGLGHALMLLDEIDRAVRHLRPVLRTVERVSGLTAAQARALMRFADQDGTSFRTTPHRASLTALSRLGLVSSDPARAGQRAEWRLTDAGQAARQQIQGLRIRIVDTAIAELDTNEIEQLRASVRRVGETLSTTTTRRRLPSSADGMPP